MTDKILILDFGSQVTQLIARRVRENGVYSEIHPYTMSEDAIRAFAPITKHGQALDRRLVLLEVESSDEDPCCVGDRINLHRRRGAPRPLRRGLERSKSTEQRNEQNRRAHAVLRPESVAQGHSGGRRPAARSR